ncbi:unnamed protein product [Clonostachys chloroleuca]|uniref:Uncharacterized protein n=1 Tax=Clonostachys chloroleuca TaxID=1926264 RepID=A0AA35MEP8_9HYPO|nr:unnamed protein product [Clonostachys chloroleuca]
MALLHQPDQLMAAGSVAVVIFIAILSIGLYSLGSVIYRVTFHPLAKVPGPKLYAISQLPYLFHLVRGDWTAVLKDFHDYYGPVVRFAPNDVSFTTDDALKKIYGHKTVESDTFEKDLRMYRQNRPVRSIITSDNEGHRRMRRLIAHAFSEKALRNQQQVLDHYIESFIRGLTERSRQGADVDIVAWYNFATFDLIGDLAFGKSFGCLENGDYHPWVRKIFDGVKFVAYGQAMARLGLKRWATVLVPPSSRKSAEQHMEFSRRTALARIDSGNTVREDFMSYILRHNDDEKGMSKLEITENSATLILAGSETTATLLSGATFLLLKNRDKYEMLTKEIRSAFESAEDITLGKVNQLEYLLAVLNESLRMYPPVPAGLPRLAPAAGEFIEGYWIPANTSVSVPHWSAYRSAGNFREPDSFIPERWLNDPLYASDVKSILQPFSYGPRNCIGKNLAYAEMRLILTHLLWKFDLELDPGCNSWNIQKVYILWEKSSLKVKLTEVIRAEKE